MIFSLKLLPMILSRDENIPIETIMHQIPFQHNAIKMYNYVLVFSVSYFIVHLL